MTTATTSQYHSLEADWLSKQVSNGNISTTMTFTSIVKGAVLDIDNMIDILRNPMSLDNHAATKFIHNMQRNLAAHSKQERTTASAQTDAAIARAQTKPPRPKRPSRLTVLATRKAPPPMRPQKQKPAPKAQKTPATATPAPSAVEALQTHGSVSTKKPTPAKPTPKKQAIPLVSPKAQALQAKSNAKAIKALKDITTGLFGLADTALTQTRAFYHRNKTSKGIVVSVGFSAAVLGAAYMFTPRTITETMPAPASITTTDAQAQTIQYRTSAEQDMLNSKFGFERAYFINHLLTNYEHIEEDSLIVRGFEAMFDQAEENGQMIDPFFMWSNICVESLCGKDFVPAKGDAINPHGLQFHFWAERLHEHGQQTKIYKTAQSELAQGTNVAANFDIIAQVDPTLELIRTESGLDTRTINKMRDAMMQKNGANTQITSALEARNLTNARISFQVMDLYFQAQHPEMIIKAGKKLAPQALREDVFLSMRANYFLGKAGSLIANAPKLQNVKINDFDTIRANIITHVPLLDELGYTKQRIKTLTPKERVLFDKKMTDLSRHFMKKVAKGNPHIANGDITFKEMKRIMNKHDAAYVDQMKKPAEGFAAWKATEKARIEALPILQITPEGENIIVVTRRVSRLDQMREKFALAHSPGQETAPTIVTSPPNETTDIALTNG